MLGETTIIPLKQPFFGADVSLKVSIFSAAVLSLQLQHVHFVIGSTRRKNEGCSCVDVFTAKLHPLGTRAEKEFQDWRTALASFQILHVAWPAIFLGLTVSHDIKPSLRSGFLKRSI